jgi:hypothetical protein
VSGHIKTLAKHLAESRRSSPHQHPRKPLTQAQRDDRVIAQRLGFARRHPRTNQTAEIDLQTLDALISRYPEGFEDAENIE